MTTPKGKNNTQVLEDYFELLLTPESDEEVVDEPVKDSTLLVDDRSFSQGQDSLKASAYSEVTVLLPAQLPAPEQEMLPEEMPVPSSYEAPLGSLQMVIPAALPEAEELRLRELACAMSAEVHRQSEIVTLCDEAVQESVAQADSWSNGFPDWAGSEFDTLLFDVQGLRLGLPLISLGSIHPLVESDVSKLPGQSKDFLGTVNVLGQQFTVVDTAQVVMPERCDPKRVSGYQYLVTLNNSRWALAISAIDNARHFSIDEVHWRSQRTQRPWLAGTIKAHMCALMDPQALNKLLIQKS